MLIFMFILGLVLGGAAGLFAAAMCFAARFGDGRNRDQKK